MGFPAYSGKSPHGAVFVFGSEDHPRLCGEKIAAAVLNATVTGSPPPMRGKAAIPRLDRCFFRITPRLCGEKAATTSWGCKVRGSPPPMRGKVDPLDVFDFQTGITPAYAGKRKICYTESTGKQDHPRLCGEKFCPVTTLRLIIGSPPPMRGKESKVQKSDGIRRITPAYAGKSTFRSCSRQHKGDHPRLCGEKNL